MRRRFARRVGRRESDALARQLESGERAQIAKLTRVGGRRYQLSHRRAREARERSRGRALEFGKAEARADRRSLTLSAARQRWPTQPARRSSDSAWPSRMARAVILPPPSTPSIRSSTPNSPALRASLAASQDRINELEHIVNSCLVAHLRLVAGLRRWRNWATRLRRGSFDTRHAVPCAPVLINSAIATVPRMSSAATGGLAEAAVGSVALTASTRGSELLHPLTM